MTKSVLASLDYLLHFDVVFAMAVHLKTFFTLSLLWSAYASFYLCKLNFAVAQPAILKEFSGLTMAQVGAIPSVFAFVYAIGQIINGTFASRLGARLMMTIAMALIAFSNICFGFVETYEQMLLLWALNGYAQSTGWSAVVETTANWVQANKRGFFMGIMSTSYQIGHCLSWLVAGVLTQEFGFRMAFMVPALWLLVFLPFFALFVRNKPDMPLDMSSQSVATAEQRLSFKEILALTLENRVLWVLAIAFFCANGVRYSFMNWAVTYVEKVHGLSLRDSAFTAVILPLAGSVGAISSGFLSDKVFKGYRVPVAVTMLLALAFVCAMFPFVAQGDIARVAVLLGLAGFFIYGPDMLISGALTADLGNERARAAATGLTMSAGAFGAIFSGAGVGLLQDMAMGDFKGTFFTLSVLSVLPALILLPLWNKRANL
jgi:sugar phosphate permease